MHQSDKVGTFTCWIRGNDFYFLFSKFYVRESPGYLLLPLQTRPLPRRQLQRLTSRAWPMGGPGVEGAGRASPRSSRPAGIASH